VSKRASLRYVPSIEIFAMSHDFGIEWTRETGYAGQVQYAPPQRVLDSVQEWMDRQAAPKQDGEDQPPTIGKVS